MENKKQNAGGVKIIDFNAIRNLNLRCEEMYRWTEEVWQQQDDFTLVPKVCMWQGESGRYMTMPCLLPAYDIAGVKFICRNVDDVNGLPARNSNILLQRCSQHGLLAVMDGTYITTMRTGACAAFNAIRFAKSAPKSLAVYGLGIAARAFMLFYTAIRQDPITVKVMKYKDQAEKFIAQFASNKQLKFEICTSIEELFDSDIIVSCVSYARQELCPAEVYPEGCTIIPVHTSGFQNCDLVFDKVVVDDIDHVKKYRYYESFKSRMVRITDVVNGRVNGRTNDRERIVVYNGGIALHDMYWAMRIEERIGDSCPKIAMSYPDDRFWITGIGAEILPPPSIHVKRYNYCRAAA